MADDSQLEQFIERASIPTREALALRDLLSEELPESDFLLLMECGETPSLLHVASEALVFYFIEGDGTDSPIVVRTVRIAPPRGARTSEERQPQNDGRGSWFRTTKFSAERDVFPGGRVECDCSGLDEKTVALVRKLFRSWETPGPALS